MTTYDQFQDRVHRECGLRPKTCWIAHCKEIKGLPMRRAWNRGRVRQHPCPEHMQPVIFAAFRHCGLAE